MRQAKCKRCGIVFSAIGEQTYCDQCRTEIKQSSVIRPRICLQCGSMFDGYPRSQYCAECAISRKKKRDAEHQRKGSDRKIGSEDICVNCGSEYTVTSGLQKYCPECKNIVVRENINAHKRQYADDRKADYAASKKARKTDRRVCPICGNTFTSSTSSATCSVDCSKKLKQQWQKNADQKRTPRNRTKKKEN